MTVAELIKALGEFNPNNKVKVATFHKGTGWFTRNTTQVTEFDEDYIVIYTEDETNG